MPPRLVCLMATKKTHGQIHSLPCLFLSQREEELKYWIFPLQNFCRHQSRVEGKIRITWISLNSWCEGGVSHFPNPGSCCFPQGQEKSGWTGLAFCHCHSMNSDVPSREKATIHPCPISLLSQDPSQKTQDESWKCQLHQGSEQMDQKTQKWTKNCIPERSGKGDLGKTVFYPSRLGQKIPGVCV